METEAEAETTKPHRYDRRKSSASGFTDLQRAHYIRNVRPEDIESTFTTSTKHAVPCSRKIGIAVGMVVILMCVAIAPIYLSVINAEEQIANRSTELVKTQSTVVATSPTKTLITTLPSESKPSPSTVDRVTSTSPQTTPKEVTSSSQRTSTSVTSSTLSVTASRTTPSTPKSTPSSSTVVTTSTTTSFVPTTTTSEVSTIPPIIPGIEIPVPLISCAQSTNDTNKMIPKWFVCDSVRHCVDNSDEKDCDRLACKDNFKCSDGDCVSFLQRCDGIKQCKDASDERLCDKTSCANNQHRCPSGQCIPKQFICDRKLDCSDGSDEENCLCYPEEFRCRNGKCIAKNKVCNKNKDCTDGEDEGNCVCESSEFSCSAGGCVKLSLRCDGSVDCPDASDEHGCLRLTDSSFSYLGFLKVFKPDDGYIRVCPEGWTPDLSDLFCQQRSYSQAAKTEVFKAGKADGLCVNPNMTAIDQIETSVTSPCSCASLLRVECRQHDIGNLTYSKEKNMTSQWPWVVALFNNAEGRIQCSATLITPAWMITAASCFNRPRDNITNWFAYPGTEMPLSDDKPKVIIDQLIIHPGARSAQFGSDHDLALLHLATNVDTNHTAIPVGIPRNSVAKGTICAFAGFGPDGKNPTYAKELQSNSMHTGEVRVSPASECNSSDEYNGFLQRAQMCLRPTRADLVQFQRFPNYFRGDIGAPVMCKDKANLWSVDGILTEQTAGVSTLLATPVFRDVSWIEQITGILVAPGFCFNKADGKYADQYDCASYLECFANLTFRRSCGTGTVYNNLTTNCDFRNVVDCGDRPVGIRV